MLVSGRASKPRGLKEKMKISPKNLRRILVIVAIPAEEAAVDALAVEMEAAGVALVAEQLKIPFVALKTIADRLNPDNSIFNDFNQFLASASQNAGQVIQIVWNRWILENS